MSDLFWLIHVNLTQLLSSAQTKPNTSTVDCLHSVYSPSGDFWNQQSNMGVDLSSDHAISQSLRPILTLWQDYVSYVSRCSGCEGVPPNEADFYRCFTSETGCCFSFTALNENQLQTSVGAVRMCVCVCLCGSSSLCGKKPDPNSLPANCLAFFFLFHPFFLIMFCLLPLKQPDSPFPLNSSTDPLWPGCSVCPCVLLLCLSSPHLPAFPSESVCFVWRGKGKQWCLKNPPPTTQMDHTVFMWTKSMPRIQNLGMFSYIKVCDVKT